MSLEDRTVPSTGALDPTFGAGGLVTTTFSSFLARGAAVAVQADGKIVVAGDGLVQPNSDVEFLLVRYNANGSLDDGSASDSTPGDSFGSGGKVIATFGPGYSNAKALAIQPDGKIVVAGAADASLNPFTGPYYSDFALARWNSDGSPDVTFGAGGEVTTRFYSSTGRTYAQADTMALQPDGRIVVAGQMTTGFGPYGFALSDFAVARYNSDGTLDSDFGGDGRVTTDFDPSAEDQARGVVIQPDGKIVVVGVSSIYPNDTGVLARYNPDGTLDSSFDSDGKVTGVLSRVSAVALQNDGKIVAAGVAADDFGLARFNSDGSLDTTFSYDGLVATDFDNSYDEALSVVIQPNGKIVVAGDSYTGNGRDFALAGYNANGTLDASFGGHGKVTTDFPPDDPNRSFILSIAFGVALQVDGKIVLAGTGDDPVGGQGFRIEVARYLGDSPPSQIVVAGSDSGSQPLVRVFDAITGEEKFSFLAFDPGFTGGVRVAAGDVNGDGIPDIIAGQGPGGSQVRIFNGATGALLPGPAGSYFPYGSTFTGGVFVAAGDVNGDGKADVITGPDAGLGPRVKVFSGVNGALLASLRAYHAAYTGGVHVAAGDVNGDGRADIITGRGRGGPAVVRVFDGLTRKVLPGPLGSLLVADSSVRGGVFVTAGDVNGDGRADIIATAGPTGAQTVRIFDGATGKALARFQPFDPTFPGEVRVGLADVNGDGRLDIIAAAGPGGPPEVRFFDALSLEELDNFYFADVKSKIGVFVAGSY